MSFRVKTVLTITTILFSLTSISQSVERFVVSPFGGGTASGAYYLDDNMGEAVIERYNDGIVFVGQGFVQPDSTGALTTKEIIKELGATVFPNPATTSFTITLEGSNTISSLIVKDASGRLIFSQDALNISTYSFDIQSWSSGLYFVQIKGSASDNVANFKLIKN